MLFNDHSNLKGKHALLSPSSTGWENYTDEELGEKLLRRYLSSYASTVGTVIHEFAAKRIENGLKLNKFEKNSLIFYLLDNRIPRDVINVDQYYGTVQQYVNDAIGFGMTQEQVLYYSDNCFGTADAIYYGDRTLRIHDLKTGTTPVHMEQLVKYAALFFLEYRDIPVNYTKTELRIYQGGDIIVYEPEVEEIENMMKHIIKCEKKLYKIKMGA